MKDRWLTSDRELNDANGTIEELRDKLAESEKDYEAAHATAAPNRGGEGRRNSIPQEPPPRDDDLADISRLLSKTVADLGKEVSDAPPASSRWRPAGKCGLGTPSKIHRAPKRT